MPKGSKSGKGGAGKGQFSKPGRKGTKAKPSGSAKPVKTTK